MNIWIIRHGESEGNKKKIFGKSFNLTSRGENQAKWIRDYLIDKDIQLLYCSSLSRAIQTSDIIAGGLKLESTICDELREIEYGELENKPYSFAEEHFPQVFSNDPEKIMTIGYPGGETHMDVYNRVIAWFKQRKSDWTADSNIAVVTHAMVAKILITILLDNPGNYFVKFKISNGSATCIERINNTGYLVQFNKKM